MVRTALGVPAPVLAAHTAPTDLTAPVRSNATRSALAFPDACVGFFIKVRFHVQNSRAVRLPFALFYSRSSVAVRPLRKSVPERRRSTGARFCRQRSAARNQSAFSTRPGADCARPNASRRAYARRSSHGAPQRAVGRRTAFSASNRPALSAAGRRLYPAPLSGRYGRSHSASVELRPEPGDERRSLPFPPKQLSLDDTGAKTYDALRTAPVARSVPPRPVRSGRNPTAGLPEFLTNAPFETGKKIFSGAVLPGSRLFFVKTRLFAPLPKFKIDKL